LPLPVEALIVEEVALLDYDATVHIVRVEDTCGEAGRPSAGGGQGPDPGGDSGGRGNGGGRGPPPDAPSATGHPCRCYAGSCSRSTVEGWCREARRAGAYYLSAALAAGGGSSGRPS
jgi:hypothetical protein